MLLRLLRVCSPRPITLLRPARAPGISRPCTCCPFPLYPYAVTCVAVRCPWVCAFSGCLGCVLDGQCANHHLDKQGSRALAERLLALLGQTPHATGPHLPPVDQAVPSASTADGGGDGGAPFRSTSAALEQSPVRRERLRAARDMHAARAQGATVRQPWTNTLTPDFMSDGD